MAINLKTMKCPECGADLEFGENSTEVVCNYCGKHILVENTNEYIIHDEAAVKQVEADRDVKIKQIDFNNRKIRFIFLGVVAVIALIAVIFIVNIKRKPKIIPGGNGYVVGSNTIDFVQTILGQAEIKKELIVYTQDLTTEYTITKEGLFSWSIFKKSQRVDFAGKATYSIDLSRLREEYITVDDDKRTITLNISSSEMKLNVTYLPDQTKFYDIDRGSFLAFGDIKMTPEEKNQIDTLALEELEDAVESNSEILRKAESSAEQSLREIFQPIIDSAIESSGSDMPKYKVIVNVD